VDGRTTVGKLMVIPQPEKCIWPCYDLYLWPLTLKSLFNNGHSHGDYLWQVSLKWLH